MRATARRYWGGLLLVGALLLPGFGASGVDLTWSGPPPEFPFLETVTARNQGLQKLSAIAPALTLTPPLPSAAAMRPSPQEEAVDASRAVATAAGLEGQTVVVIREGQTLWEIARAHGVAVEALAAANGIGDEDVIHVGQRLVIPGASAAAPAAGRPARPASRPRGGRSVTVVVESGQTLWDLAQTYGVPVDAIVEANGLSGDLIRPGQRLVIPGVAAGAPRRVAAASRPPGAVSIARGFLWPARGSLRSRFGWRWQRHHDGIDIAAPYGTPIYAAKAGRVVFAGWYYGYGRTVILDHGNGVTTLYGHASRLLVRVGDQVDAGQPIALVGSTGYSTGPHLHFEIRVRGRPLDPLKYL
ncbi:MAG: peptidoglycan DD-metalloendopeptidase family protein [Armatimonadota bacterium]|nr:peptidoglycan DD-metalloendopeptidase family protein [Armatimonadota bacterium]MDR7404821.1 peptidoglycan DD-metalloendopeptidase family protein [Armatimonadota bacterium]